MKSLYQTAGEIARICEVVSTFKKRQNFEKRNKHKKKLLDDLINRECSKKNIKPSIIYTIIKNDNEFYNRDC